VEKYQEVFEGNWEDNIDALEFLLQVSEVRSCQVSSIDMRNFPALSSEKLLSKDRIAGRWV